ncbi:MAG: NTP transferase domain-containing protein [Coraliomargaritaceae bacterium]
MKKEVYGLVLAGGKSRRMGRDKALLCYSGESTQLERTVDLLSKICQMVFVSQRKDQSFPIPSKAEVVFDSIASVKGPLCGILSAMQAFPQAHWLVLACDLPFVTVSTLEKIITSFRASDPRLTAYRSSSDGLPEPLCAIYPIGSNKVLLDTSRKTGNFCPRKLLIINEATLIDQEDPSSLDNINTSAEFEAAKSTKLCE